MPAVRIHYTGKVQGVGFRFAVKQLAQGFEVTGTVRNLDDGRVRLEAEAEEAAELDDFLEAIRASHLGGFIRDERREVLPPLGASSFGIVR